MKSLLLLFLLTLRFLLISLNLRILWERTLLTKLLLIILLLLLLFLL